MMPKAWKDVLVDPQFQALSPGDKEAARAQYFNEVVSPQVPEEDRATARQQFDNQYGPKSETNEPYRGTFLPFRVDEKGDTYLALPDVVKSFVDVAKMPGQVLSGELDPYGEGGQAAAREFAMSIAGGGGGAKVGRSAVKSTAKDPYVFADAAKRFGMNFSKAKAPQDIAAEITRAVGANDDRMSSLIWDRTPQVRPTGTVSEVGENAVKNFVSRKAQESSLWDETERVGNTVLHDSTPQVEKLQAIHKEITDKISKGFDTPDVKKSGALVERVLAELGHPVQEGQKIIEKTVEKGGVKKTTTGLGEQAADAPRVENTIKEVEPSVTRGPNMVSATTQEPVKTTMSRTGTQRVTETSPYTVTTRTVKGAPAAPPRQTTAGDLARAMKAVNRPEFSSAGKDVLQEIRSVLNGGLAEAGKANKNFTTLHQRANRRTQANADIYRDDAKSAKFGFDEETLRGVASKTRQGRMIDTNTLEKFTEGVDKIETPEDLLILQRTLDKPQFNAIMRAKFATLIHDIGLNPKALEKNRPLLEKIYEFSGLSKSKTDQLLNDRMTVAKEAERYGVTSEPVVEPSKGAVSRRAMSVAKAINKAVVGKPTSASFYATEAAMPVPKKDIELFRNAATPSKVGRFVRQKIMPRLNPSPEVEGAFLGTAIGAGEGDTQ